MSDVTRRDVMMKGGMIAIGLTTPRWFASIAHADLVKQAGGGKSGKTVLVVCQLTGGNDGLNTIVPYADPLYKQLRPGVGLSEADVLKINDSIGFHPAMAGIAELYKEKKVAVIQNVGYPNPNRSHFKSMDIWQSASPAQTMRYGWVGRHLDQQALVGAANPILALGLSTEKPLALTGEKASIPCFASLVDVQSMVGDPDAERMLRQIQGMDAKEGSPTRVVQDANRTAFDAMSLLSKQLKTYTPKQTYGNDPFGQGFKQIAQLIATSPQTRVVYFSSGGFDTHARQLETHATLLGNMSKAITAFQRELEALNKADNVIVLVFSEFGRRVRENSSLGTDHGAAAPMMLIGKSVKGGLHGKNPNLADLDDGDIKFETDFRSVYATALDDWLGGDSGKVLGSSFAKLPVL